MNEPVFFAMWFGAGCAVGFGVMVFTMFWDCDEYKGSL